MRAASRSIALAAWALAAGGARASAEPPGSAVDRQDFANAFGVDVASVLEARRIELTRAGAARAVVVGRYREHADGKWTFPGLGVIHPCASGFCITRVSLGEAAARVTALEVVDLDGERTELRSPIANEGPWGGASIVEPGRAARWPALVLAIDPQSEGPPRRLRMVVVSLRDPAKAERLLDREVLVRYPEGDLRAPNAPPPTVIGRRTEAVVFERRGDERALVITERPIESRNNPCLRPKPEAHRLILEGNFYRELPSAPFINDGCH